MTLDSPRRQHYIFAHGILPALVRDDPQKLVEVLLGEDGEGFLAYLWRRAGEEAGDGQLIEPRGLGRTVENLQDGVAVLITMPEPQAMTEAHLAAVVSRGGKSGLFRKAAPQIRYFTLEYGLDLEGGHRTVLCEWNDTGHMNYGDGPPADAGELLGAILKIW